MHVFQCCLEDFDVLLSRPLRIPRIKHWTKAFWILRHVMVGIEVQWRRFFPKTNHEGRRGWYLMLKSNLGLHRSNDNWEYTLDLEGRGRGSTLAMGRMRPKGSLEWLSGGFMKGGGRRRWKRSGRDGGRGRGCVPSLGSPSPCGGLQLLKFKFFWCWP